MNPLFIFCILIRVLIAYLAKTQLEYLEIMSYLAFIIASGFLTIYILGLRKTGMETFGKFIWWDNIRPIHSFIYYLFAVSAFYKKEYSWIFLAIDVLFGTSSFIHYNLN